MARKKKLKATWMFGAIAVAIILLIGGRLLSEKLSQSDRSQTFDLQLEETAPIN